MFWVSEYLGDLRYVLKEFKIVSLYFDKILWLNECFHSTDQKGIMIHNIFYCIPAAYLFQEELMLI